MGLLEDDDEGLVLRGQTPNHVSLASGEALGVQLQYSIGSTVLFDGIAAAP